MTQIPTFHDEATFAELLGPAMRIAEERNHEAAEAYVDRYVAYLRERHPDWSQEQAHRCVMSNVGYYAGYYGQETREAVLEVFGAEHPVFGRKNPTPEEAFEAGLNWSGSHE